VRFEGLQSKQLIAPMEVLAPAQLNDGVDLTIQHQNSIRIENLVRVSHVDRKPPFCTVVRARR